MQRRPTVGPGSQKAPFRERLPGAISKLGKGTALQRWQTWGLGGEVEEWRRVPGCGGEEGGGVIGARRSVKGGRWMASNGDFLMVFIGNPRSETKGGGGSRIILRSKPS